MCPEGGRRGQTEREWRVRSERRGEELSSRREKWYEYVWMDGWTDE